MNQSPEISSTEARPSQIEKVLAILIAGSFLFASFALGLFVAGVCLHDPDTCWHLALGKWITSHLALPLVDPFSSNLNTYATVSPGKPLMQYEWLSEVIMYWQIHLFGLAGLIMLTAAVLAIAFLFLPTTWLASSGCPLFLAFVLSVLGAASSSFRFLARPEMFSYLALSSIIYLFAKAEAGPRRAAFVWTAFFAAIFAFWANAHILFPVGLLYVCLRSVLSLIDAYLSKRHITALYPAILAFAFFGTLINPWGLGLWQYFLLLPNSPTTSIIIENAPFQLADLTEPTYFPLYVLLITSGYILLARLKAEKVRRPLVALGLFFFALALTAFKHRLMPFAALSALSAVAESYSGTGRPRLNSAGFWFFSITALSITGSVLTMTQIAPPSLPQASKAFHPPFKAINFLQSNLPKGRLFNDWQLGSMIEFYLPHPPDIFLDGRISSYSPDLVFDYRKMRNCRDNWQELLGKYKINWVFLIAGQPLASNLAQNPDWQLLYADKDAVILQRKEAP